MTKSTSKTKKTKKSKPIDEMERKEFLKQIIKGLDVYATEHRITEDFQKLFYTFVARFMPTSKPWHHISDFILAMSNPIKEINAFSAVKDPFFEKLIEDSIITDGTIRETYRAFLGDFKDALDSEESYFLPILYFCQRLRNREDIQKLYEYIRKDYFTLQPVLTDGEYTKFIESLKVFDSAFNASQKIGNLSTYIKDFYRLEKTESICVCPRCGYPMEKKESGYECLAQDICQEYYIGKPNYTSQIIHTKRSKRWILKESFYRYISLPGRFEYHGYEKLKKIFGDKHVTLYPNCEKDGDVKITLPNGDEKKIDFKDHRFPDYLLEKLKDDSKAVEMDYIVVPDHFYKFEYYKREIQVINQNQSDYRILSLRNFLSEIKTFKGE
jgi:hypothetical protein